MEHIKKSYHQAIIRRLQNVKKYKEYGVDQYIALVKLLFPEYRALDITNDVKLLMVQ